MSIAEEKKLLRKAVREEISVFFSENDAKSVADELCQKVFELEEFKKAGIVFAYIPSRKEADCMPVIEKALSEGKTVFVPRVHSGTCSMDFYELDSHKPVMEQLEEGAFGILEPKSSLEVFDIDFPVPSDGTAFSSDENFEIFMLVPGLAFTENGERLGKGKGFYDRYFERLNQAGVKAYLCGFCLPCQLVERISCDLLDIKMNRVVS